MSAISVRGLIKSYGDTRAVDGVDLEVGEGEVLALLGPNGAGKSTTIEILEGHRDRDGGEVTVLGVDPAGADRAFRERIGIVLQTSGIDRELTVAESLEVYAPLYPTPRDIDEVIGLVGLTEKRDARVSSLSGGQQRRLDLALGIVGDPDLIFLDEPTTGFDPSARRQSWGLIESLRSLGKTILLTTHYMDEAQHLADRVVVIARGRVVAEGTPDEIGGRAAAASHIDFAVPPLALPDQFEGRSTRHGGRIRVVSSDPTSDLHELTSWALREGFALDGLEVTRPSLEDVYLRLTDEP